MESGNHEYKREKEEKQEKGKFVIDCADKKSFET